jgi:uncharacterized membrane protein YphA (DoxX/SURF4 family)
MPKRNNIIIDVISMLFIFLFIYAAISKLIDFEKFRTQLGQSPLLTDYANWVSVCIPLIEICLSLVFLISRFRLFSLYACFGMMVMFTAYIIVITKFSDHIPCSCGGVLQNMSWREHLIFNLVFTFLAAWAILIYPSNTGKQEKPKTCKIE